MGAIWLKMDPRSQCWDQEKSLFLIEKFKLHEALWNPNNKAYHNAKMKEESWKAIAEEMKVPAAELKKKIECLRGSYRRERSLVRSSRVKEEEYRPKWFAFKSLSFLDVARPQNTNIRDREHGADPLNVSEQKIILHSSEQCGLNEKNAFLNNESILSPKKMRLCSTTVQDGPKEFMSESAKRKSPLVMDPTKKGMVTGSNDSRGSIETVTHSPSVAGKGSPPRLQGGMSECGVVDLSECPRTSNKCISTEMGSSMNETSRSEEASAEPHVISRVKYKSLKRKPTFESEDCVSTDARLLGTSSSSTLSREVSGSIKIESTAIECIHENTISKPDLNERKFLKEVNNRQEVSTSNIKLEKTNVDELDECTEFGRLVESTLRNLPDAFRVEAKMKLGHVLWKVGLEALKQNPIPSSYCKPPGPRSTPSKEPAFGGLFPLSNVPPS